MQETNSRPTLTFPAGFTPAATTKNVVIIGANGSGKSRLGAWLEDNNTETHRISAQRALKFKDHIQPKALPAAEAGWRYGHEGYTQVSQRNAGRWNNSKTNHVLNDFDFLLETLFARKRARDSEHSDRVDELCARSVGGAVSVESLTRTTSALDEIQAVWKEIFPHRAIHISGDAIHGKVDEGVRYPGKEMSDGERVAIYLLGQALCVGKGAILILDEPEIHLHRAVLRSLFDSIEKLRPDCLFVYITHDVDFATTRDDAHQIWVRSWDGGSTWIHEVVEPGELPTPLLLMLLGNRRPVLFVEGTHASNDFSLFSAMYPEHLVVPRGSCVEVIESTRAYQRTTQLSRIDVHGIIDRDHRSDAQVKRLSERNPIHVLGVAEVENVFLTEPVVRFIAVHMKKDADAVFGAVKALVFSALRAELEVQAYERSVERLRNRLEEFDSEEKTKSGFIAGFVSSTSSIDPEHIFDAERAAISAAVAAENYEQVLSVYNRKNLSKRVAVCFGLSQTEYAEYVLRLVRSGDGEGKKLRAQIRSLLPSLEGPPRETPNADAGASAAAT